MIAVLVADDHTVVREGIRHTVEAAGDIKVCGEAADAPELREQVDKHRPDVVILDMSMPGLEALQRIHEEHPETRSVVLSDRIEAQLVQSAIAAGADAYLPKNAQPDEIVAAVRAVAHGGAWFSPRVAKELACAMRESRRAGSKPLSTLSGRERQVLHLIADGLSAKEVAARLSISTKTVEAHRTSLMRKLGVRKATELVRYAVRHGLVEP